MCERPTQAVYCIGCRELELHRHHAHDGSTASYRHQAACRAPLSSLGSPQVLFRLRFGGKHRFRLLSEQLRRIQNFARSITAIRYAWAENPCCPTVKRGSMPCPPTSCSISTFNSTLPGVLYFLRVTCNMCRLIYL